MIEACEENSSAATADEPDQYFNQNKFLEQIGGNEF